MAIGDILGDVFEFFGGAAPDVLFPPIGIVNSIVDIATAFKKDDWLETGDKNRVPPVFAKFKVGPKPQPPPPTTPAASADKRKRMFALLWALGDSDPRQPTWQFYQQVKDANKMTGLEMQKYRQLFRAIYDANPNEYYKKFGFKGDIFDFRRDAQRLVVGLDPKSALIDRSPQVVYRQELARWTAMTEAKKQIDKIIDEATALVTEYKDKGYNTSDSNNVADRFGEAFMGRINRSMAPFKALYASAREHVPGFSESVDSYEQMFDESKKTFHQFQQWIDENDVPVLNQVRTVLENQLEGYKAMARTVPGGEEVASVLIGKDLDEANWLDILDTAGQYANPAYSLSRGAMELNRATREALERKPDLSEAEFLELVTQYLIEEVNALTGDQEYDFSSLDVNAIENELSESEERKEAMKMINPFAPPGVTRPPSIVKTSTIGETYMPIIQRADVNMPCGQGRPAVVSRQIPTSVTPTKGTPNVVYRDENDAFAGLGGQKGVGAW